MSDFKANIVLLDTGLDRTIINVIDTNLGVQKRGITLKGRFSKQAYDLIGFLIDMEAEQVIFDDMGVGRGLKDAFYKELEDERFALTVEEGGHLTCIKMKKA